MIILHRTGRYSFFASVFILMLQVTVVTGQNKKGGVTVSYESGLAAPESRASQTQIHFQSEWSSHIMAQECMVLARRLVKMRLL